ncbi:MAG: acylphosphatase [Spirochaetales bacterium]|nr:acylphosphatase [Leptospiraceae bacterium]MCP5480633.1 acylphosphatase [Spirochaetales bacterium]MCP5483985.1 acylphosphatase [Spirochaetales bacterium]
MQYRYLVSGRVQGVGFRYYVSSRARTLGLAGFVRNLPDGRVECAARGDEAQLQALEADLRAGPAMSRVTNVERSEWDAQLPLSFEVWQ